MGLNEMWQLLAKAWLASVIGLHLVVSYLARMIVTYLELVEDKPITSLTRASVI